MNQESPESVIGKLQRLPDLSNWTSVSLLKTAPLAKRKYAMPQTTF